MMPTSCAIRPKTRKKPNAARSPAFRPLNYTEKQEAGEPIDLTIMDLTIQGGMGGEETIAELKALDPEAKVIVCSGHSNDPIMVNFRDYGFNGAIQKPFHPDELNAVLGDIICA